MTDEKKRFLEVSNFKLLGFKIYWPGYTGANKLGRKYCKIGHIFELRIAREFLGKMST